MTTSGTVHPGWEPLLDAFEAAVEASHPGGAALSIRARGVRVVDLWGGQADPAANRPWQQDTLTVLFSCTKGVSAVIVGALSERGLLDIDSPSGDIWPELQATGVGEVTVGDILAHRAGLSAPRDNLSFHDLLDGSAIAAQLAAQAPLWPPGTAYAYHAVTMGWLVEGLVSRATGRSIGAWVRALAGEIAPDLWIGLPASEQHRVAKLHRGPQFVADRPADRLAAQWIERSFTLGGALPRMLVDDSGTGGVADPRLHRVGQAAVAGIGSARSLADFWAEVAGSPTTTRLVSGNTLAQLSRARSEGEPYFPHEAPFHRYGAGVELHHPPATKFMGPSSIGHDGAGGQRAFADPESRVGFAFLTNHLGTAQRADGIVSALADVIGRDSARQEKLPFATRSTDSDQ